MRTRLLTLVLMCGLAGVAGAQGKGNDLQSLQRALEAQYHLHAEKIPMMGMVDGFARMTTKGGVRGMRVVTYEGLPEGLDLDGVAKLVKAHLSEGWSLMVRDHDGQGKGSDDMVWLQPVGERVKMLVVSMEPDELDLVQMELSPDELKKWTAEHGG